LITKPNQKSEDFIIATIAQVLNINTSAITAATGVLLPSSPTLLVTNANDPRVDHFPDKVNKDKSKYPGDQNINNSNDVVNQTRICSWWHKYFRLN
jgi:hypothetical protein